MMLFCFVIIFKVYSVIGENVNILMRPSCEVIKGAWSDFSKWSFIFTLKGALDKCNIDNHPQLFPKKVEIFMPLEVLAWVMTACWVWRSRLIYFWRNMNTSSLFYFSKSTSINTQYSSLWLRHSGDDAVHIIPHKMKTHWQNQLKFSASVWFKFFYKIIYKKIDVILVQCPFKHNHYRDLNFKFQLNQSNCFDVRSNFICCSCLCIPYD